MDAARFDNVPFEDEKFRIYYRPDVPLNGKNQIMPHWHEHIEFAYFTDGEALVLCDDKLIPAHAGDFFIINSNTVHGYRPGGGSPAHYHSFVLDALFFDQLNLNLIKYRFKTKISGDAEVDRYVKLIISELDKRLGDYRRIAR
jgi:gentisate 1,2-dioxygenase